MKYTTCSPSETKKLAGEILKKISERNREGALVFALSGQLGAGKTKFVQGAAEFLGIERNVTSPTFVLMKRYGLLGAFNSFYHFDCYRLYSSKEVLDLGWEKIISNPKNIIFVEWAEKIKNILPSGTIYVTIKDRRENKRELEVRFLEF